MFIEYLTLDHTRPCLAEPGKIVVVGKPSQAIDAVFPLLNAMLPNVISYNPGGSALVLRDEFAAPQPNADLTLIQRSVAICKDDFIASRVAALAEYFGAKVNCFEVKHEGINGLAQEEAHAFVERILYRRRHHHK